MLPGTIRGFCLVSDQTRQATHPRNVIPTTRTTESVNRVAPPKLNAFLTNGASALNTPWKPPKPLHTIAFSDVSRRNCGGGNERLLEPSDLALGGPIAVDVGASRFKIVGDRLGAKSNRQQFPEASWYASEIP